jgi:DNA modification methylase
MKKIKQTYKFGDCRELLKEVKDESIDLVVTSPPYNIGKKYVYCTIKADNREETKTDSIILVD